MQPSDSPVFIHVMLLQSANLAILLASAMAAFWYRAQTGSRTLALFGWGLLSLALPIGISLLDSLFFWSIFGPITEKSVQRSIPIKNAEVLIGQFLTLLGWVLLVLALLRLREDASGETRRPTTPSSAERP